MGRRFGVVFASVLLLLALSWPMVAPGEVDSLPISHYPMFAHPRERVTPLDVAVWIDADGVEHGLDLRLVGGTDQPMQAAQTVKQAVWAGEADQLCSEIAARINEEGRVQVVVVHYDAIAWFAGDREPAVREVHAECPTGVPA